METGSRDGNLAPTLNRTVKSWLARNGRTSIPLIVAHTHEHEDHIWGDKALLAMNDPAMPITFVPSEVEFDFPSFEASVERLIKFTEGKPVAQVLGNHIEQTSTPFLDYPVGTMYQPHQHELALTRGTLLELGDAVRSMHGTVKRLCMRDFSVWPVPPDFMSPEEDVKFKQYVKEQRAKMWDLSRFIP